MLLRSERDENIIDQTRHKFFLLSQEEKIRKQLHRIEALEDFIIEQDEVSGSESLSMQSNIVCSMSPVQLTRLICFTVLHAHMRPG